MAINFNRKLFCLCAIFLLSVSAVHSGEWSVGPLVGYNNPLSGQSKDRFSGTPALGFYGEYDTGSYAIGVESQWSWLFKAKGSSIYGGDIVWRNRMDMYVLQVIPYVKKTWHVGPAGLFLMGGAGFFSVSNNNYDYDNTNGTLGVHGKMTNKFGYGYMAGAGVSVRPAHNFIIDAGVRLHSYKVCFMERAPGATVDQEVKFNFVNLVPTLRLAYRY